MTRAAGLSAQPDVPCQAPWWCIADRDALSTRSWAGESVVYDDRSGATHRLGRGPSLILSMLGEQSRVSELALAERLRRELGTEWNDQVLQAALEELERLELVRSEHP